MQPIVQQIHKLLLKNKQTLAIAESCTGGLISSWLTALPGSSRYFMLTTVVYSNQAKRSILKIPAKLLQEHGSVSSPVALKMAQNIRKIAKTDYGIAVTGIAGPTGAVKGKPIGTVFIGASSKKRSLNRRFLFKGTRTSIRIQAAIAALKLLKKLC